MPYKIVETIERGRRLIETVPSSWESDGNLYWPRKNFMSLKKNEESTPQHDWKCLPCILVRDNILDYKAAELEVALMSDATDTDDKENYNPQKKTSVGLDLNDLLEECKQLNNVEKEASPMMAAKDTSSVIVVGSNTHTPMDVHNIIPDFLQENASSSTKITVIHDSMLQPDDTDSSQHLEPQITQTIVTESVKVPEQIGYIIELVSTVQENQKVLFENQQSMLKALALLNTKLEEIVTRSQRPVQHEQHENSISFKTIKNIDELTAFEEQLKNSILETQYFRELSIVCSEKKTGHNNAYALVDAMFDRKFMTHCSWAGGTKGEPKHCFKSFSKTINLFLKLVHQYDKSFSKPICEQFFKNVMRHSTKRNISKRERDSTTKKKIKKSEAINELQGAGPSNDSNPNQ